MRVLWVVEWNERADKWVPQSAFRTRKIAREVVPAYYKTKGVKFRIRQYVPRELAAIYACSDYSNE